MYMDAIHVKTNIRNEKRVMYLYNCKISTFKV